MREVKVTKTAGFCFGVQNAVDMVYKALEESRLPVYSLGDVIHNRQVIKDLALKGMKVVEKIGGINENATVIIRAHGAPPSVYRDIEERHMAYLDSTCPYVKKIHDLVQEKYNEGWQIIIVGDRNHPEVVGINGWCGDEAKVVKNAKEAEKLELRGKAVCVVAQTTITRKIWDEVNEQLHKKSDKILKIDTICNATCSRQQEASELAKEVQLMIVIGDKKSSNTKKLYDVCKEICDNTIQVESANELPEMKDKNIIKIGITAGASTPKWLIEEVTERCTKN